MSGRWLTICFFSGLTAFGQPGAVETRRADIRGGGGSGKCTIEVVVDGVAEVEVRGDTARLRTLTGRTATWRRFVCNQVMPPNPGDFRFRGIDGRGRQELVRDPGRGGVAVVRIEDSKGGSEGYTFDLEWQGAGGGGNFGGGGVGGGNLGAGGGREGGGDFGGGREGAGREGGGWRGNSGSTFNYQGDGRGFFNRREGGDLRVRNVNVRLTQEGRVILEFEAERTQRLAFVGRATSYNRDSITAELAAGARSRDVRGEATIYLDRRGEVERITMGGRIDGDPFKLNWSAR